MSFDPHKPLYNAVSRYAESGPARFHMPGHKGALEPFDVTELTGTDNLSCPRGAIAELEALCAEAFRARDSIISVNGSTACNIAMLLALGQNKRVLTARNCHRSVVNGLALAGHTAYLITPDENGMLSPEDVSEALDKTPCDAVIMTSPTYRGYVCDVKGIAKAAHSHGALLLVDCAHGAHFAFSDSLPEPPTEADMWCVSCHKTLNALNQSAVLNIGFCCDIDKESVRRAMFTVHTTSPSYPLMLSIENAINHAEGWGGHCERIEGIIRRLNAIPSVHAEPPRGVYDRDITRLNISVEGMTGCAVEEALVQRNVHPEMSDMRLVTLITSPNDRDEWYDMLYAALEEIVVKARNAASCEESLAPVGIKKGFSPAACPVRDAVFGPKRAAPLEESVGLVCAEAAGVYPPGSAILFPGEAITREAVGLFTQELAASGGDTSFGLYDGKVMVRREEGGEA